MTNKVDGRFIESNAVNGSHIALLNGQYLKWVNAAGDAVQNILRLNSSDKPEFLVQPVLDAGAALDNSARAFLVKSQIDALILVETNRALAAEQGLDARITQEVADRIAQDAATLLAAKNYTDAAKQEILGGIPPAVLDTIAEIAAALQSEQSATGTILAQLANHEARITALEARYIPTWAHGNKVVTATDITNGYIEFPHLIPAAYRSSVHIIINRLNAVQGVDFNLTDVSGKTRATWINTLAVGGTEALSVAVTGIFARPADRISWRYQY